MNRIKKWRQRSGMSCVEVDQKLGFGQRTTRRYEALGFVRVPCNHLYKMAQLYKVSELQSYNAIDTETRKLKGEGVGV